MFLSSPLRRKCLFFFTVLSCKRSQLVLHKNKICKFHLLTPLQRRYWNKAKCMLCTLRVRKSSQKERMSLHITLLLEGKISFGLQKKKDMWAKWNVKFSLSRTWSNFWENNVFLVDLHNNPSFEFAHPLVLTLLHIQKLQNMKKKKYLF